MSYELRRTMVPSGERFDIVWPLNDGAEPIPAATVIRHFDGGVTLGVSAAWKQPPVLAYAYGDVFEALMQALHIIEADRRVERGLRGALAEIVRATQIEVIDGDTVDVNCGDTGDRRAALAAGKGVVFYVMEWRTLKARMATDFPDADVWYTERNGDPIGLLVPRGTPPDRLPNEAKGYFVMEWIDPDKDFGTGVQPQHKYVHPSERRVVGGGR